MSESEVFVGRQPIFDRNLQVYAYELLFRSSSDASSAGVFDGDSATSQVILNTFLNLGLEKIVGEHKAFINVTRIFISNPELIVMPPDQLVLELLEDIEPSQIIIDTLKTLKEDGHILALDDFVYDEKFEPFLELADIVKIDIMALDRDEIQRHVKKLKHHNIKLLAEKVETHEEFEFLKDLDFDYYQGYFFSKPSIVQGKSLSPNQLPILRLISKINNPDVEVEELSNIISTDVSLSHKVLKFINSPLSGLRSEVDSIQQAVVLLGLTTIKNWVTIMALANGSEKPLELSTLALIRGRCCELQAKECNLPKADSFFTVGLFSTLDAMMDRPLEELIQELALSEDAKVALLEHKGIFGEALNSTLAMERSDFSMIGFADLDMIRLSEIYLDAIYWADELAVNFNKKTIQGN